MVVAKDATPRTIERYMDLVRKFGVRPGQATGSTGTAALIITPAKKSAPAIETMKR